MVQDERKKNKKKRFEHAETSGKGKRAKWSPTFFKSVYLSKGKEDDYIKRASLFRRPPRPIETETYLSSRRRPCPRLVWYSPNYLVKDYLPWYMYMRTRTRLYTLIITFAKSLKQFRAISYDHFLCLCNDLSFTNSTISEFPIRFYHLLMILWFLD